jgi:hypothetical protein
MLHREEEVPAVLEGRRRRTWSERRRTGKADLPSYLDNYGSVRGVGTTGGKQRCVWEISFQSWETINRVGITRVRHMPVPTSRICHMYPILFINFTLSSPTQAPSRTHLPILSLLLPSLPLRSRPLAKRAPH